MRLPALHRQARVSPVRISPARKTMMKPGRGLHSKSRSTRHLRCFGMSGSICLPNSSRDRSPDAPLVRAPCGKEEWVGSAGFRPKLLDPGVLKPSSGGVLNYGRLIASLDENADEWARTIPCRNAISGLGSDRPGKLPLIDRNEEPGLLDHSLPALCGCCLASRNGRCQPPTHHSLELRYALNHRLPPSPRPAPRHAPIRRPDHPLS